MYFSCTIQTILNNRGQLIHKQEYSFCQTQPLSCSSWSPNPKPRFSKRCGNTSFTVAKWVTSCTVIRKRNRISSTWRKRSKPEQAASTRTTSKFPFPLWFSFRKSKENWTNFLTMERTLFEDTQSKSTKYGSWELMIVLIIIINTENMRRRSYWPNQTLIY